MFEDSLLESAALLRSRNRWPALLSITAECAVAVFIVSLPLLHPELIRLPSRISVSLASPHFPRRSRFNCRACGRSMEPLTQAALPCLRSRPLAARACR